MPSKDVLPKFAKGQLHSGSKKGPVVKSRRQAKAIAASEAKNEKKHGKYKDKAKSREKRLEGKPL